jgi:hypothetical protein
MKVHALAFFSGFQLQPNGAAPTFEGPCGANNSAAPWRVEIVAYFRRGSSQKSTLAARIFWIHFQ